jgi:hypothetical protein
MTNYDREAFRSLLFERCARGFTLAAHNINSDTRVTFAFEHIEDLAAWLVEQYGDLPEPEVRNAA